MATPSTGFTVTISASVQLLAANANRRTFVIQNQGPGKVIIAIGTSNAAVASPTPNGFLLNPIGGNWETDAQTQPSASVGSLVGVTGDIAAIAVDQTATVVAFDA